MVLFHSMSTVSIWTIITVILLIWFGTGRQPFVTVRMFLQSMLSSKKYLLVFAGMLAILLLNKHELKLEQWISVSYDLTPVVTGWEGSWVVWLQTALHSDILTLVCAFFYLVVFQSVMIASVGIYTYHQNLKLFYAFCVALLLNYFIAVPFYLFVPVNEVWFAHSDVKFLMLDAFPAFEQQYRALSGINNCFPSLHTSISVTMAVLAGRSGIRKWAAFTWINAIIIIFSIFYLGIHWFTDMVAGLVLGTAAAAIGLKIGAGESALRSKSRN
ncbi:phosphoesterase PA-phosphatase [Cohnella kolymensis]|uniref:Phosphoesterase PA-phosphatase n=1 Tax=Cohnella kolymensis TaxID=1590652 RepID=A0ABR5A7M5_9BACL|nr:phosphatase PAP2 family protein [Cohnella kolymensis]KIL36907.1 phosphoesterase PA-phosphatase [Cohnella kolymensis]